MTDHRRYVFALWHGGINYSASYSEDMEFFATIGEAKDALYSRAAHGAYWRQAFNYVYRDAISVYTPNADDGAGIDVVSVRALSFAEAIEKARFAFDLGEFTARYKLTPRGAIRKVA